ncbi:helix-turn-helix domain-containing protein [Catelliglobosispora koreensis]|uniref:helix-turn-helix domain-containing protein n=1 Tax=Catelliglobosispora koreensis TaxID=129052 RepID=UPI00037A27A0|nr:helix-turn-helix transcriptional regulator [Catelliglobosispora koreensis]
MSEMGGSLRAAREAAGLSLSGLARRTGYSRSYLGNIETGTKQPTPDVLRAYERALGDDVHRRDLFSGLAGVVAGTMADGDIAADIVRGITAERSRLLATAQTSHATDKAIGIVVSRQTPCVASLAKWMRSGNPTLRVNAAGILAKSGLQDAANAVAAHLRADAEARQLYLTAVVSRVLSAPWDDAGQLARTAAFDEDQIGAVAAEVANVYDAGARWCAIYLVGQAKPHYPGIADVTLHRALSREPSRELLRHIGFTLAGVNPVIHKGA